MKLVLRVVVTLVSLIGVYMFAAMMLVAFAPDPIRLPGALAVAAIVGAFVWTNTGEAQQRRGLLTAIVLGAFLTGAVGFLAGFVGPMVLTPEANQGPLLGIFLTGPLGFVLGAIGGAIYWLARHREVKPASA